MGNEKQLKIERNNNNNIIIICTQYEVKASYEKYISIKNNYIIPAVFELIISHKMLENNLPDKINL